MAREGGVRFGASRRVDRFWSAGYWGDALFVSVAAVGLALAGWLSAAGSLGGFSIEGTLVLKTLPPWGVAVFKVWMVVIAVVSLVLPAGALAVFGRYGAVRRTLLPYVLVLMAQIMVEMSLSAAYTPNIVVPTGLVFTSYRLWRLFGSRKDFAAAPPPLRSARVSVEAILFLGLILWSGNLAFLLCVAVPRALAVL